MKARAEALTAKDRARGVRSVLNSKLANGPPLGFELWSGMAEEGRVAFLEDVFALWLDEYHPARNKSDIDTDLFISMTIGDLLPRRKQGSRGQLWDVQACMAEFANQQSESRLLGERMASADGAALLCFLKAVADGRDDRDTDRGAFDVRMAAVFCARQMAVASRQCGSLITPAPATGAAKQTEEENVLFLTLRDLNLATWALSACDTLAGELRFQKGMEVRICDLRNRIELNGRKGTLIRRAARVAGRAPRWHVQAADGRVVSVRARNLTACEPSGAAKGL